MRDLFVYGTLRHMPLLHTVLGHVGVTVTPARLPGYEVFRVDGADFPGLRSSDDGTAEGIILNNLAPTDLERLDFYEFAPLYDYFRIEVFAETDEGSRTVDVYLPSERHGDGGAWSLQDWVDQFGAQTTIAAEELMGFFGTKSAEVAHRHYMQMRVRAASRVRAENTPKPARIRSNWRSDQVDLRGSRQPHTNFFAMTEQRFRFPRFNGEMSQEVEREGLLGGDAVTVLPYDPVRDRVMVIEQFRFSPFMRGDPKPWVLEPVAGRIDPDETPEQAGLRELVEEAAVKATALHHVASYYPTTSCLSEYVYSYIGICDLPDDATGIAGLEEEGEDIRSHILSFDRAYELLFDGEADAAPLILSLMWLARERERLRKGA